MVLVVITFSTTGAYGPSITYRNNYQLLLEVIVSNAWALRALALLAAILTSS